jgi:phosphoglycerate kinase
MDRDFYTLDDFDLGGKTVLLRVDINCPINPATGEILDDSRMRGHIPTFRDLRDSKVVVLAHQSKPGKSDFTSLQGHAERLSSVIARDVHFAEGLFNKIAIETIKMMTPGDVLLLENTRFFAEDVALKDKDPKIQAKSHIVKKLASVSQYYINDAFAAAHRSQPTIVGFAEVMPALAGRLMEKELVMLGKLISGGEHPSMAVLGGAKVDDSIDVMEHFLKSGIADKVLGIGVVGNILLLARGIELGPPSMDFLSKEVTDWSDLVDRAKKLIADHPGKVLMPTDVALNDGGERVNASVETLPSQFPIHDIGYDTIATFSGEIEDAQTVILNGPAGVFELENFSAGTKEILNAVARCKGFTVVGGGHTSAAVEQMNLEDKIDHVSTGGGALISFLTGKPLPGVEALKRAKLRGLQGKSS